MLAFKGSEGAGGGATEPGDAVSTVTVVGLLGWGLDEFRVEVVDAPGDGAKAQVTLPPVAEW